MLDYQCPRKKESRKMHIKQRISDITPVLRVQGPGRRNRVSKALLAGVLSTILATIVLPAAAQVDTGYLLLDNVRLIVGDGQFIENGALLIDGDTIVSVGSRAEISPSEAVTVVDLSGKTLIPAMIDSHAHIGYEGYTSWGKQNYSRANLIDHLQRYAYYGFSAVFSAGSDPHQLAYSVQQAQMRGEFSGARFLYAAGMAPPGQGPNDQFLSHALAVEEQTGETILYGVASEQDVENAVKEIKEKNISVIKIWVDDRGGTQQKLSPELYHAITSSALSSDINVYAHQQSAEDMPDLLRAGVTGFLHGRIGAQLDAEISAQIAEAGAFVVPNLGLGELRREAIGNDPFLRLSVPPAVASSLGENQQRRSNPVPDPSTERGLRSSFRHLLDAGVDILLGTDAGAVPNHFFGYTGHRELEIFVRLGMSPMEAIISATSKPAQRLGLARLGLLKAGYSADFIVLDNNPLEDIRNTRSISAVYLNGNQINREQLSQEFVE